MSTIVQELEAGADALASSLRVFLDENGIAARYKEGDNYYPQELTQEATYRLECHFTLIIEDVSYHFYAKPEFLSERGMKRPTGRYLLKYADIIFDPENMQHRATLLKRIESRIRAVQHARAERSTLRHNESVVAPWVERNSVDTPQLGFFKFQASAVDTKPIELSLRIPVALTEADATEILHTLRRLNLV